MTIGILLIGILFGFQIAENDTLKFSDNYGNEFLINDDKSIPNRLNFDFLKDNLNGTYFIENISESEFRYKFNIIEIERLNRNNYRLRIMIIPQTDNLREILKYQGFLNYKLKIKKSNGGIELRNIEFMYGEV
ncbi:hypothetical protein [uncultured Salegentibacter sp.]|uniref:hypothetical protein n=1 Tax=uncultured Salegentibacter sp. TaxID=259320 RepID=UPI00259866B8|nr:hypothetical protein [uncultured Salegentibacter sp.]